MKVFAIIALMVFQCCAVAQHWKPLGLGALGPGQMSCLSTDSIGDRLIGSGTFKHIANEEDTVLVMGMAAWNGTRWDSVAHRIQVESGNIAGQVFWSFRYQGVLYTCGAFGFSVNPDTANFGFAQLNEETLRWEPLACINSPLTSLYTLFPREPQEYLYATGHKTDLCGYPESCVFRYDGSAFHEWPPWQQIPYYSNNYVGTVFDFRGYTYMTGSFRDPLSNGYCSMMRHNGTNWEYVPGWGNAPGPIKDMSIRNDTLYLAGAFRMPAAPGNGVASFDGTTWNDLGGGIRLEIAPQYSVAQSLHWFQNELYAGGQFSTAGGIAANGFAKWNGRQWCSLPGFDQAPGPFTQNVVDMATFRDSLYIVGAFEELEGQPMNMMAQWIGGDAVSQCSAPVAVHEAPAYRSGSLVVVQQQQQLLVRPPHTGPWQLALTDAAGRTVSTHTFNGNEHTMPTTALPQGLYLVSATTTGERYVSKVFVP